jgi:hypothetical protein
VNRGSVVEALHHRRARAPPIFPAHDTHQHSMCQRAAASSFDNTVGATGHVAAHACLTREPRRLLACFCRSSLGSAPWNLVCVREVKGNGEVILSAPAPERPVTNRPQNVFCACPRGQQAGRPKLNLPCTRHDMDAAHASFVASSSSTLITMLSRIDCIIVFGCI